MHLSLISILFWVALLGGIALGSRLLPRHWYDHRSAFFRTRAWELRLYDRLHIRAWKDYLPELGVIVGFAKDHLSEVVDKRYIDRFLWETCYTEVAHWICMVAGFSYIALSLLLDEPHRFVGFFIAISLANFVLHIPFILIQRYNRPRLEMLREKICKEA